MKRKLFSIITALALCLSLLPATAWAEEGDEPKDITNTGLTFQYTTVPKETTVYRAGDGTVTWTPTVSEETITHGTFIFNNASFDLTQSTWVLYYSVNKVRGLEGDIDVVLIGKNTVTAHSPSSTIFSFSKSGSTDTNAKLTIKGENGGSLTFKNDSDSQSGSYYAINISNDLTIENATLDFKQGGIYVQGTYGSETETGNITIKHSQVTVSRKGAGLGDYTGAIWTAQKGDIIISDGSTVIVDSDTRGISSASVNGEIHNSTVSVTCPYTTGSALTLFTKVTNSTLNIVGGNSTIVGSTTSFDADSKVWNDYQNPRIDEIRVAGTVSIAPEPGEITKQVTVWTGSKLTVTNDTALDIILESGGTLTAANVQTLYAHWTPQSTIALNEDISSMTVTDSFSCDLKPKLEYTGKPKNLVLVTVPTEAEAAKIQFDTDKFEQVGNQIRWKQTPLATPTGLSWSGTSATWSAVTDAAGYEVQLFKDGTEFGTPVTVTSGTECDFFSRFTAAGTYTFKVKALSSEEELLQADSEYSAESAGYVLSEYTVTFDSQGGSEVAAQTVLSGKTAKEPSKPTLEHYNFKGWFTDAEGTELFDFSTPVTSSLTLYAKWSEITTTGVTLDRDTLSLKVGETGTLTAAVIPENTLDKSVTWSSSDSDVATVDSDGKVTAVSAGTAIITVTTTDGSFTATCTVTVTAPSSGDSGSSSGDSGSSSGDSGSSSGDSGSSSGDSGSSSGGSSSSSGGSGSNSGGSSSSSSTSILPVTTTGQNSSTVTTTTTAAPSTNTQGGTATTTINTAMGNEIVKQAATNNSKMVVIAPSVTGSVTKTEVSIPASTVGQIGSRTSATLTVSTPVAGVTIPNGGLDSLASAGGTVTVTAEQTGRTVELTVTAGGKTVAHIPGGVTLTVPAANATPGTVAVLVNADGTREVVRKSVAGDSSITIPLDGSAKLEIADNSRRFADVPAASWAADAVAFASSHELFNSTAPNQFSPDLPMSRGMLAVVLHNLENNPAQALTGVFADVDSSAWYAEGVAWATSKGIVDGYGNGQFGPDDNITREQLAVMLWRYAGSPAAIEKELHFADAYRASNWALDALCWATENGIINGKGSGILDPTGQATRAETAQMLKNFMENR